MPRPLSKDDLRVLATLARAQPRDNPPDEAIVERLAQQGYVTSRRGRLVATDKGKAEVEKRRVQTPATIEPAPPTDQT